MLQRHFTSNVSGSSAVQGSWIALQLITVIALVAYGTALTVVFVRGHSNTDLRLAYDIEESMRFPGFVLCAPELIDPQGTALQPVWLQVRTDLQMLRASGIKLAELLTESVTPTPIWGVEASTGNDCIMYNAFGEWGHASEVKDGFMLTLFADYEPDHLYRGGIIGFFDPDFMANKLTNLGYDNETLPELSRTQPIGIDVYGQQYSSPHEAFQYEIMSTEVVSDVSTTFRLKISRTITLSGDEQSIYHSTYIRSAFSTALQSVVSQFKAAGVVSDTAGVFVFLLSFQDLRMSTYTEVLPMSLLGLGASLGGVLSLCTLIRRLLFRADVVYSFRLANKHCALPKPHVNEQEMGLPPPSSPATLKSPMVAGHTEVVNRGYAVSMTEI